MQNLRTAQDIRGLFRRVDPRRSTPTARALKRVLEPYLQKLEAAYAEKQRSGQAAPVKPLSIVVLTGEWQKLTAILRPGTKASKDSSARAQQC